MARLSKILAFAALTLVGMALAAPLAFAAEPAAAAAGGASYKGLLALGAGLGIGLAAFGGALGQGKTAGAALEGIARNPGASGKIFVPMILGLALIESLVIYALIISFQLVGKL
jgi:F-type H+-transporting ATPase subunit c